MDPALAGVLKAVGTASRTRTLRHAMSVACHGDRPRLAACLEAMPPAQLVEMGAAARLLSTEADQALTNKAPHGCAAPAGPACDSA
ncbi:hypothetical protein [Spongiactinospora sp. TRM90649]|uniref:hypothetical protein n=1 Tax=Spongiactinospora sp. TRM90649 TaxID=3031114 RepID=UPI0023F84915|nr:hypothetical protein [Spongiactinospora sp. TRM90649]MDF5757387.1 hypothetical protein [Spongiactinospora sp. TRM90649]